MKFFLGGILLILMLCAISGSTIPFWIAIALFIGYWVVRCIKESSPRDTVQSFIPKEKDLTQNHTANSYEREFKIVYRDIYGQETTRDICVIEDTGLYIRAWCFLRNAERTFNKKNIKQIIPYNPKSLPWKTNYIWLLNRYYKNTFQKVYETHKSALAMMLDTAKHFDKRMTQAERKIICDFLQRNDTEAKNIPFYSLDELLKQTTGIIGINDIIGADWQKMPLSYRQDILQTIRSLATASKVNQDQYQQYNSKIAAILGVKI